MRRLGPALVALAALGCSKKTPATVLGFEGELVVQSQMGTDPPTTTVVHLQGDKAQAQLPSNTGAVVVLIADGGAKKNTWLFHAKHEAIVETMVAHPASGSPKVTSTGRHDVVAGTDCDVVEVRYTTGPGAFNEVCVAKSLTAASLAFTPIEDVLFGSPEDLPVDGFPLRVLTRGPSGAVTARMEVTKIEKVGQPKSLFEIPAGFTTTTRP